jgi:hypothetical protein
VEWLSELNRTARKPEIAPRDDDFPELAAPGFVPQPMPLGHDLPIRAAGFPYLKPGIRLNRRKEESFGIADRIPGKVAIAHELTRTSRAIWLSAPLPPEASLRADAYRSNGRFPIYSPEIGHAEHALAVPVASCLATLLCGTVCDVPVTAMAFSADPFDWKASIAQPVLHLVMPSPELTAGCCDLPFEARPYVGEDVRRPAITPERTRTAELELPPLDIALASTDIRGTARPEPPHPFAAAQNPPHPSHPSPATSYSPPFYPPVVYPVPYPVAVPSLHELPPTGALLSSLMSASAARRAPATNVQTKGTAVDAATIASILPALLASGWLRIEPEMAHPVQVEPSPLREHEPEIADSGFEPLGHSTTPRIPRLNWVVSHDPAVAGLCELRQFPCHAGISPAAETEPLAPSPALSSPFPTIPFSGGLKPSTALYALELQLRVTKAVIASVDVDWLDVLPQPVLPRSLPPLPLKPAWKRRRLRVQPSIHPLDLSAFDIPAEAGEWARD